MLPVATSHMSNSVPLEAVLITAGAVIVAAVIGVVAAQKRLQATLKAERDRADDALQAARKRHADQLRHDRELADDALRAEGDRQARRLQHDRDLADIAELRVLLDGLMGRAADALSQYVDLVLDLRWFLADVERSEREVLEKKVEVAEDKAKFHATTGTLVLDRLRIQARLPTDHPVAEAHWKLVESVTGDMPMPDDPSTEVRLSEMDDRLNEVWQAQREFISACRDRYGSKVSA
jgi:uncharacterized membrane protein YccC